jgi:hypothetical protein
MQGQILAQLVKIYPAFYGNRFFLTTFTKTKLWTLTSETPACLSLRSNLKYHPNIKIITLNFLMGSKFMPIIIHNPHLL